MKTIFTLRGHNSSVTALADLIDEDNPFLISGDTEGTVIIWDLDTFKKFVIHRKVASSPIQSLKVVNISIEAIVNNVLIVQFREHGLQLFTLKDMKKLVTFKTYCPLFSRGDALNVDERVALLAYPSCLNNHTVTIRLIGDNAQTIQSGTAQRFNHQDTKTCSIFDITLLRKDKDSFLILVAYEDGCLCLFKSNLDSIVEFIRTYNFQIGDFISAFDVTNPNPDNLIAVLGSPHADLIFLCDKLDQDSNRQLDRIKMKKRGVSAIKFRPDYKHVAVACWDSSVRLFSMESREDIATLQHHSKQVQCILFFRDFLCCASMDGTISISDFSCRNSP